MLVNKKELSSFPDKLASHMKEGKSSAHKDLFEQAMLKAENNTNGEKTKVANKATIIENAVIVDNIIANEDTSKDESIIEDSVDRYSQTMSTNDNKVTFDDEKEEESLLNLSFSNTQDENENRFGPN